MSGLILGRSPALIVGLIAAGLNAAVAVFGVPLTGEQVAVLNTFAVAAVAVIANSSDPRTLPTLALATRAPAWTPTTSSTSSAPAGDSSSGTGSSPGAPTAVDPTAPIAAPTGADEPPSG